MYIFLETYNLYPSCLHNLPQVVTTHSSRLIDAVCCLNLLSTIVLVTSSLILTAFFFTFLFLDDIHRAGDTLYKLAATGVSNFGRGSNKSWTMTSTDNSVSCYTRRYVLADCSLRMHGTLHGVGGGLWELVVGVTQPPARFLDDDRSHPRFLLATGVFCCRGASNCVLQNSHSTRYVGRAPSPCRSTRANVPTLFRQVNRDANFLTWAR